MNLIHDFVLQFKKDCSIYEDMRDKAAQLVESSLMESGILAITSSRVKDPDRLYDKILSRNERKQYEKDSDIFQDIVDLIGIRIALYFPNDIDKIDAIIRNLFDIHSIKEFPSKSKDNRTKNDPVYTQRFPGYCATHYRVYLKKLDFTSNAPATIIEIQVASLLMHAWAEVEHDLVYKQKKGEVSRDEYESLDEINGLVIAGEVSLQRLQRISELRISSANKPFTNHYQLASFIYDKLGKGSNRPHLGDVETLFRLFQSINRLTPAKIENDLEKIDLSEITPVSEQMINIHSDSSAKISNFIFKATIQKKQQEVLNSVDNATIGAFLKSWIKLERRLNELWKNGGKGDAYLSPKEASTLLSQYDINNNILSSYTKLRTIRNRLIHGNEIPNNVLLQKYIIQIEEISNFVSRLS